MKKTNLLMILATFMMPSFEGWASTTPAEELTEEEALQATIQALKMQIR